MSGRDLARRDEGELRPAAPMEMAAIDADRTIAQLQAIKDFCQSQMVRGVHYGTIPGVDRPFLWKAGSEWLGALCQLGTRSERDKDFSYVDRQGELVEITIKATAFHRLTGRDIQTADGFASSGEACFRAPHCPKCMKFTRRGENRGQRACRSCDWQGPEAECGDGLANDFGTTIRNVAARAEKRAKVRAIAEAAGVTSLFLTPESWEQEEDGAAASTVNGERKVCPTCQKDVKHIPAGISKKSGNPYEAFYACKDDECGWKGQAPLVVVPEPSSAAETPAPDEAAVSPEGETVGLKDLVALCEEQFQRLGRTKPAQQKVKVAELAVAAGLKTVPEDWREMPADLLGQLLDMLTADEKVLGGKDQQKLT